MKLNQKKNRSLLFAAAAVGSSLVAVQAARRAANGTWAVDADGNWSTTTNWAGGTVADGGAFTASFTGDITANRTVTLDTSRTIRTLSFDDSGATGDSAWILNSSGGSTLTFAPSPQLFTAVAATIEADLTGTNGLTKTGADTLTLKGAVGITGTMTFFGGTTTFAGSSTSNEQ